MGGPVSSSTPESPVCGHRLSLVVGDMGEGRDLVMVALPPPCPAWGSLALPSPTLSPPPAVSPVGSMRSCWFWGPGCRVWEAGAGPGLGG